MNSLDLGIQQIASFLFILTRCSGIFVFTPFLGNALVPVHVRIVISVCLAYLLVLSVPMVTLPGNLTLLTMLVGLGGELLVGMAIGFAAHTVFAGFLYAGQLIGFQIGLSFVNTVDPQSSSRSTTLAIFLNLLAMMLFLGFNGHHWLIESVSRSFTTVPTFHVQITSQLIAKVGDMVSRILVIGFQVAAPVMSVLILTDLVLGLIGRSAPQIHIMIIGFPIKILVGLSCFGLGLYFLPSAMRDFSVQLVRDLHGLVRLLGS
ncbi:MAG: flagellar biosynthetic protein FliR [Acidobacteriota bacterium]